MKEFEELVILTKDLFLPDMWDSKTREWWKPLSEVPACKACVAEALYRNFYSDDHGK